MQLGDEVRFEIYFGKIEELSSRKIKQKPKGLTILTSGIVWTL
jgi:hypothetical protein